MGEKVAKGRGGEVEGRGMQEEEEEEEKEEEEEEAARYAPRFLLSAQNGQRFLLG